MDRLMQHPDNPPSLAPPPSPTFILGFLGMVYLAIGGIVLWAYSTGRTSTGTVIFWDRLPRTLLWLTPGTLLILMSIFVRHAPWAVVVAAAILGLSAMAGALMLIRMLIAFPTIPLKAAVIVMILGTWLSILMLGLARLRRQWLWLRAQALPAGRGFFVSQPRGAE